MMFCTSADGSESPTERMRITTGGEIYTTQWQSYSPTVDGIDDYTGGWRVCAYMKLGRMVFITVDIAGHQNAGSANFKIALPVAPDSNIYSSTTSTCNSGVWAASPGHAIIHPSVSTTQVCCGIDCSGAYNNFSAVAGAVKAARFTMFYYAAA